MPIPENEPCEWSSNNIGQQNKRRRVTTDPSAYRYDNSLINQERLKNNLPAMKRSSYLEQLAKAHARSMASRCNVVHSANNAKELGKRLKSDVVGENVQSGKSIRGMHAAQSEVLRQNILGDFNQYGMGTARGADGKLYLCQLFRTV